MPDNSNKKVLIIYTGGTIGMKRTERGYAPVEGYFAKTLTAEPDLFAEGMPDFELFEMSPLLDSSNMSVKEWNVIGELIYKRYAEFDGFVILHGTDTMAYTASALSFMLEGLSKPVILTGSQIPLSEVRSDGRDNLAASLIIAADGIVKEVCIAFGGKLMRGNRVMKMSADGLNAFYSPNYPLLAEIGIGIKYDHRALLVREPSELRFVRFKESPVGVLKVFPGMQLGLFEEIMVDKLVAIVIETFGTGNVPDGDGDLLPVISRAFAAGTVICVTSQCPKGAVTLGAYKTGSGLKRAGAVTGGDMTTEAAVAKLYYLFSKYSDKEKIKEQMECSVAGELS